MKKSWGLTDLILAEQKTVETRWYQSKRAPWDKLAIGDKIYFKDSGDLVRAVADIRNFEYIQIRDDLHRREIVEEVWEADVVDESKKIHLEEYSENKKYCILIYLKNPRRVEKPFQINKRGFGAQCAWITVKNIKEIAV